jgi:hypothetical protein
MIEVEAPDGSIVEFPAGTSREVMRDAMRRRFGGQQAPQAEWQPDIEVTSTAQAPDSRPLPMPPPPTPQPASAGRSFMQGLTDPLQGGAQLLTNALPTGVVDGVNRATATVNNLPVIGPITRAMGMTPATREQINNQTVQREDAYAAERNAGGDSGIDWLRMAGNVASAVPAAVALPTGASVLGAAGAGAATGAGMSALQPVDNPEGNYWDDKKAQVETGGMFGAVTGPLGYLAGRMIAPRVAPEVRTLAQEGVELTPGQLMGGVVQRVESGARGLPFIGDPIVAAQNRSLQSFNRAAGNRVLAPLGETLPDTAPAGREMIGFLQQRVSQAYDDALLRVQPFLPDNQFGQDIAAVGQQFMTPESRNTFLRYVQDRIISRFQGGPLDGPTYQTIRSDLGRQASNHLASSAVAEREIGEGLIGLQRAVDALMARQNPAAAPQIMSANAAYSTLQRLNAASGSVGAVDGVFSPAQLQNAVRTQDRSVRRNAFARGDAPLQDLSDAGRGVIPNTVADSGTGFRGGLIGLMGGAAAGVSPMTGAALLGGTAAAYSDPARRALTALMLTPRPYSARVVGDALAYSGGAVATPLAASMLAPPRPASRP